MPALTRRSQDHHQECWHVYCGAVYVGTIVRRIGNPHDTEPWEWRCRFYPDETAAPKSKTKFNGAGGLRNLHQPHAQRRLIQAINRHVDRVSLANRRSTVTLIAPSIITAYEVTDWPDGRCTLKEMTGAVTRCP